RLNAGVWPWDHSAWPTWQAWTPFTRFDSKPIATTLKCRDGPLQTHYMTLVGMVRKTAEVGTNMKIQVVELLLILKLPRCSSDTGPHGRSPLRRSVTALLSKGAFSPSLTKAPKFLKKALLCGHLTSTRSTSMGTDFLASMGDLCSM